jgi:release factor glutamine methyltransferase
MTITTLLSTTPLPRHIAEVLLAHILKKNRTWLYTWSDHLLTLSQIQEFSALTTAYQNGTPLAYLTGTTEFYSLPFLVSPDTLIPRPETELLVAAALEIIRPGQHILDLGTGSGCIALAIAHHCPDCVIDAVDSSASALKIAHQNQINLTLPNVAFYCGNWYDAVPSPHHRYHCIVANPPYIACDDPHISPSVRDYEPISALFAHDNGLHDIRTIITNAPKYLHPNTPLIIEHGFQQGQAVRQLFEDCDFQHISTQRDLAGHERFTMGRR